MIDDTVLRLHLKIDEGDIEDVLLAQYLASAISVCEGYCNRRFYESDGDRVDDRIQARLDMLDAVTARGNALADPDNASCEAQQMILDQFASEWAAIMRRSNGVTVDETIRAAILLTAGHLYRNRQDVIAGAGSAAAVQLPNGARRILEPYLWVGNLSGGYA